MRCHVAKSSDVLLDLKKSALNEVLLVNFGSGSEFSSPDTDILSGSSSSDDSESEDSDSTMHGSA
uniref:Uncharacterized protein n=1 Tax=Arundo donax TaxID=35708 RepID=A0A0A9IMY3_ARUDO